MDESLVVTVEEQDADDARLEELALGLRQELLETDVDDVRQLRRGEAPPGTRALDIAAIGGLLVTLKASTEVIGSVVDVVRRWLSRGDGARSVTLTVGDRTLILQSASADQQERLIQQFLEHLSQE